jgi:3-hydroxyacyl-CoA dehydrogenase
MAIANALREFKRQGRVTDHDITVCKKLAHVLSGGDMPTTHKTTEDHILDLEREAFLSLCGLEKTQERRKHMLTTGKPLRN